MGAPLKPETNRRWIVTTVIAVAALLVSGYAAYAARQNNIHMETALEETRRQFEATGPKLAVDGFISIYNPDAGTWGNDEPPGISIPFERLQPPNQLHVIMYVTNVGRSRGGVEEVGIMKDETTRVALNDPECDGPGDFRVSCQIPFILEPGARAVFYIRIDEDFRNALTCNPFSESQGIVAYAKPVNSTEVTLATQVSIAYSSYCPELRRSLNGTGR